MSIFALEMNSFCEKVPQFYKKIFSKRKRKIFFTT